MHRKVFGLALLVFALTASSASAAAGPTGGTGPTGVTGVTGPVGASTLGQDLIASDQASALTGATFSQQPFTDDSLIDPAPTAGEIGGGFLGFPTNGLNGIVLTSGDVTDIVGDQDAPASTEWVDGPEYPHGDQANDVTTLKVSVDVPASANCLAVDFRFLSEEYPEYVGSEFNDAFIAEIDTDDWSNTDPYVVKRPHDFATDLAGPPVSVNGVGDTVMVPGEAAGTVLNAATALVTTKQKITPGSHDLYFSIYDASDHVLDSAVFLDNLRFFSESPTTCKPPLAQQLGPPPPPPAANNFSFGKKIIFGKGFSTLSVTVPGAGVLVASDGGIRPNAATTRSSARTANSQRKPWIKRTAVAYTGAGTQPIKLKLTSAGRKTLKRKRSGRLKVKVRFAFTPVGGSTNIVSRTVTFKKKK